MERLVAQEIDAVKLVAEALAGGERDLEIGLAEYISVAAPFGRYGNWSMEDASGYDPHAYGLKVRSLSIRV